MVHNVVPTFFYPINQRPLNAAEKRNEQRATDGKSTPLRSPYTVSTKWMTDANVALDIEGDYDSRNISGLNNVASVKKGFRENTFLKKIEA